MSGPAPKHPSVRARRNNPRSDFTSLPADGRKGGTPPWPLSPDVQMTAAHDVAQDKVASLMGQIDEAEDGRTKGRLRRQLAQAELTVATLSLQIEQMADAEQALWSLLWSTPQATMWEASTAFARMLAQFVRWNVKAEQGDLKAAVEARQRGKDFGLTPLTLLGLKAEVERVEDVEDRGRRRRSTGAAASGSKGRKKPPDDPRSVLSVVS